MGQRITALAEKLEGVVETGRVRLPLIGDRPEFFYVIAEDGRGDAGLARGHPVDIAAQGVDFAVMGHHAEGMRQLPGGKGVGGKTLMHQRQGGGEIGIRQVFVIGPELAGQEHAFVDDRPA